MTFSCLASSAEHRRKSVARVDNALLVMSVAKPNGRVAGATFVCEKGVFYSHRGPERKDGQVSFQRR